MNQLSISLFLLGSYYGFLATLPISPSKILSVRSFLLESKEKERNLDSTSLANAILIAGISGLFISQILILLSIYSPSLYSLWVQPHTINLFLLPSILFCWNKMKNYEYISYYSPNKQLFSHPRVQSAFLETMCIQLLNPIFLSSPVFSRMMGLFFFRYSYSITFLMGSVLGIGTGYSIFLFFNRVLVNRLEYDTPVIYQALKRILHKFFLPVILVLWFISLGRSPIPYFLKKIYSSDTDLTTKLWPDILYDDSMPNRPFSLMQNRPKKKEKEKIKQKLFQRNQNNFQKTSFHSLNKMHFSQFFFDSCIKNGTKRLCNNYQPSIAILHKEINSILEIPSIAEENKINLFKNWVKNKTQRRHELHEYLVKKMEFLDLGFSFENLIEKKLSSKTILGSTLKKEYDPRLVKNLRDEKSLVEDSSVWLAIEGENLKQPSSVPVANNKLINGTNEFKLWFSDSLEKENKHSILPWEKNLRTESRDEKDYLTEEISWEIFAKNNFLDIERIKILEANEKDIFKQILYKTEKILKNISNDKNENKRNKDLDLNLFHNSRGIVQMVNMYKPMPLWNSKLTYTEKPYLARSQVANFIHDLLPGTIRARRRKTLLWNIVQNRPHAPIFLRTKNLITKLNSVFNLDILNQTKSKIRQKAGFSRSNVDEFLYRFVRNFLLVAQVYLRKVKLVTFIVLKNLFRTFLLQSPEWKQDWQEFLEESYINFDENGSEADSPITFKNFFEGKLYDRQIRIVNPFHLKPWHPSISKKTYVTNFLSKQDPVLIKNIVVNLDTLDNFSYLSASGDELILPFGKKKTFSFWKPILQSINFFLYSTISKNLSNFASKIDIIKDSVQKISNKFNKKQETDSIVVNLSEVQSNKLAAFSTKGIVKEENIKTIRDKINQDAKTTIKPTRKDFDSSENHDSEKFVKETKTAYKSSLQLESSKIKGNHSHQRKKTIRTKIIYLQRNFLRTMKLLFKFFSHTFYTLQRQGIKINRNFIKLNTTFFDLLLRLYISISKNLFSFNKKFLNDFLFSTFKEKSVVYSNILDDYLENNTKSLSESYLIHKIWQERFFNKVDLTSLMNTWDSQTPLKKSIQHYLNKQGILGIEKLENLKSNHWKEWLRNFRSITLSPKIWYKIAPQYWTKTVKLNWKNISNRDWKLLKNNTNLNNIEEFNKLLKYKYLLEKTQKTNKVWKFELLYRNYTNFVNDGDVDYFNVWNTDNREKTIKNYFKQTTLDFINDSSIDRKTRFENQKELKIFNPKISHNFYSWLPSTSKQIFKSLNNDQITKKLPIVQIEKNEQNLNFSPISNNKKFQEIEVNLRNLLLIENRKKFLQQSPSYNKDSKQILTRMRKSLQFPQMIFLPDDWCFKILNENLFMHTIISSYLKILNRKHWILKSNIKYDLSISPFVQQNLLTTQSLLPEEILRSKNLQELRLLEYLNSSKNFNNVDRPESLFADLEKEKYSEDRDYRSISRFLWPVHRVEDLAYMNRFWLGTANQSRFSMLRVRLFPEY